MKYNVKTNGRVSRIVEFFNSRIHPEPNSGCWIWLGAIDNTRGYGVIHGTYASIVSSQYLAHRLSYWLHVGDIPSGYNVCHMCDIPICVNPEHLFLGTQADNVMDCHLKGRRVYQNHTGYNRVKTDDGMFVKIRKLYPYLNQNDLSTIFGISQSYISLVLARKENL